MKEETASIRTQLEALAAANRAVGEWGVSPMEARYQVLMAIGTELIERSGELGDCRFKRCDLLRVLSCRGRYRPGR